MHAASVALAAAFLATACASGVGVHVELPPPETGPAAVVLAPLPDLPARAPEWISADALFADADVEPAPVVAEPAPPPSAPPLHPLARLLSYRVDPELAEDERTALRAALDSVAARWAAATCLPVSVAEDAPHVVTVREREGMHRGALGRTEGAWRALRVSVARGYDAEPILLHELAHGIGWTNDHAAVHVDAAGVEAAAFARKLHPNARITANDLTAVCERQACECFAPEVP